jgi:ABC-2 type transport system ATP-binding protein
MSIPPLAVSIQNLRKSYGNVTALKDVSLHIQPGEIFGLLGPNGAGKTTTIRCLCTLTIPDGGHIEVSGVSVFNFPGWLDNYWGMSPKKLRWIKY